MALIEINFLRRLLFSQHGYVCLRDDKAALKVGFTLSFLVVVLVLVHIVTHQAINISNYENMLLIKIHEFINLGNDTSLSETLNHGMLFSCAAIFLYIFFKTYARVMLFFNVFFIFAWLDDSAQYHERVGGVVSESLRIPSLFGLRGQDFGELIAWASIAVMLLAVALWAYNGKQPGDLNVVVILSKPIAALIFCGVIFDMLHIIIKGHWADLILTVLEDGGEMISIAAAVAASLAVLNGADKIYKNK